jgi:hypothetical protein
MSEKENQLFVYYAVNPYNGFRWEVTDNGEFVYDEDGHKVAGEGLEFSSMNSVATNTESVEDIIKAMELLGLEHYEIRRGDWRDEKVFISRSVSLFYDYRERLKNANEKENKEKLSRLKKLPNVLHQGTVTTETGEKKLILKLTKADKIEHFYWSIEFGDGERFWARDYITSNKRFQGKKLKDRYSWANQQTVEDMKELLMEMDEKLKEVNAMGAPNSSYGAGWYLF